MDTISPELKGVFRCVRYSFMPNRLHLCGPENQADILEFYSKINKGKNPASIKPILEKFETLYLYLKLIARANNAKSPFAEKVVEAYWLGNKYLEKVPACRLFDNIKYDIQLRKKLNNKSYNNFTEKFNKKALPHHNFHVFSIYHRTGNIKIPHTLATIDACRISWGKVIKINNSCIIVKTKPLILSRQGQVQEADFFVERSILNNFERNKLLDNIKIGDYISLHWGCACEKLNKQQVTNLQKYTELSLKYADNLM